MTLPSQGKNSPSPATNVLIAGIEPDMLKKMLDDSLIVVDEELQAPPICIEILNDENSSTVGTLGNFSLLIGKAKQGKTLLISILLATAESGRVFENILKVSLPGDKKTILHFDTEQSKYHVQKVLKRICSMLNIPHPCNLKTYGLRQYPPSERLAIIEYAIENTENIGLIVIDGIRDLVTSINDEEQSTHIASKLLKWTEVHNIHIVTVLHMNKSKEDHNARGHLGTELTNKSETVISVAKDAAESDLIAVKPEYCRDKEFEPFAFRIGDGGIPVIEKDWVATTATKSFKKVLVPLEIHKDTHMWILKNTLKETPKLKMAELKAQLWKQIDSWYDHKVPKSAADLFFRFYLDNKYLISTGKTPHTVYFLPDDLLNSVTE